MRRALARLTLIFLAASPIGVFAQESINRGSEIKITKERRAKLNPNPKEKNKKLNKESVSEEDADVIANLDLLQNLELLQDYDKVTLLNLFTPPSQRTPARDKAGKDLRKGQRRDEKNSIN